MISKRYRHVAHTFSRLISNFKARRAGSDGSMSASGSTGLGFNPRRGSKFSIENFQPRGYEGWR